MAHIEEKVFEFGNTIRVRTAAQLAQAHEFDDGSTDYTHQSIAGVNAILYDANVGNGEPNWVLLEKGVDIGGLYSKIETLQRQLKGQQMYNGRLKKKAESMGILVDEFKE